MSCTKAMGCSHRARVHTQCRWLGGGERGLRVSISSVLPVRWGAPGGGFVPLLTYTLPSGCLKLLAYACRNKRSRSRSFKPIVLSEMYQLVKATTFVIRHYYSECPQCVYLKLVLLPQHMSRRSVSLISHWTITSQGWYITQSQWRVL